MKPEVGQRTLHVMDPAQDLSFRFHLTVILSSWNAWLQGLLSEEMQSYSVTFFLVFAQSLSRQGLTKSSPGI